MSKNRERVQTIGFSLVSKLSVQLWVRSLGLFLLFNLLFLAASGILLLVVGERQAAQAVRHLQTIGLPSEGEGSRLLWPGLEVKEREPLRQGYMVPIPELAQSGIFPPGDQRLPNVRSILLPMEAETRPSTTFSTVCSTELDAGCSWVSHYHYC
jgi:hypothetical protein